MKGLYTSKSLSNKEAFDRIATEEIILKKRMKNELL
jgi:hypothetical protein